MEKFEYKNSLKKNDKSYVFKFVNAEKYISRPIASLIVRMVFNTRITPNFLTYTSFVVSLPGIILIALGGYLNVVTGALLILISFIIDAADGMLARSRGSGTDYGKYLDLFLDRVSDFLIFSGIAVYKFRATGDKNWLIFGLFILSMYMFQIVLFYIKNLYLKRDTGISGDARGLLAYVILILALLNRIDFLLYLFAVEVTIVVPYRIINFFFLGFKKKN